MRFALFQPVKWPHFGGTGAPKWNTGTVCHVVPPVTVPPLPPGFECGTNGGFGRPRNHESYLVLVDGTNRVHWPRVSQLRRIDDEG